MGYEKASHKLTLVRDQLGIKPLYYYASKECTVVASLTSTIQEVLGDAPELDYLAMSEYVRYQFTFGDKTFFKPIKKVLPGHLIEIDLNREEETKVICYEDIFAPCTTPYRSLSPEWIAETRVLFRQCVIDSTISDTSFTTFCSGGLDSSFITLLAKPEIAYHCNYSDPECNETFFAQQVVEDTPIRLFTVNATESVDLVAKLGDIVKDFDEMTIGSVILPMDDILSHVKRRYKVILTGTGGDELFAGYVRYKLVMGQCLQDSYKDLFAKMRKLKTTAERFEMTHHKGTAGFYAFYDPASEKNFYEAFEQCHAHSSPLQAMLRFDRRYFLAGLLNIDDKMSGRHSVEGRPSFLHQKMVRHVQGLDPEHLLGGEELKSVLRSIAEGVLPKSVIHRTDKMGFTTPIGTFVNRSSHRIREHIMDSPFRHLYNLSKMKFTADNKFSREVFGLLMLDLWLNHYAKK